MNSKKRKRIGIVLSKLPLKVEWWGYEGKHDLDIDKNTREILSFEVGSWFRANIEQNENEEILKILTIEKLPKVDKPFDKDKLEQEIKKLGTIPLDEI